MLHYMAKAVGQIDLRQFNSNSVHLLFKASTVSSFIDLSIVYGTSVEVANALRTYTGGQMQTNQYNVLPQDSCSGAPGSGCFHKLGDSRINQSPQLALLHSLCLRAHNNNADELARVNPHWSDQKLFDESRRLTIVNHQYMVFYFKYAKCAQLRI